MAHAPAADADRWNELSQHFEQLAAEERDAGCRPLRASIIRDPTHLRDVGDWDVHDSVPGLREKFKVRSAKATRAFGAVPNQAGLLSLWLHRLYQYSWDMLDYPSISQSRFTRTSSVSHNFHFGDETVHIELPGIEEVCKASVAFCHFLEAQAIENEQARKTMYERFREWIEDNSSQAKPVFWSTPDSLRRWVAQVAKSAQIPIDFLSIRLNVFRLPLQLKDCESLRAFFDQVAKQEGLVWCVTRHGLWMAQQPPSTGEYIDADGNPHGEEIALRIPESAASPPGEQTSTDKTEQLGKGFEPSADYLLIRYQGREYKLTPHAAKIAKALHDAAKKNHGLTSAQIKRVNGGGRYWDAFRSQDGEAFRKDLIEKTGKSYYTLKI
jgi:hypothetical protein